MVMLVEKEILFMATLDDWRVIKKYKGEDKIEMLETLISIANSIGNKIKKMCENKPMESKKSFVESFGEQDKKVKKMLSEIYDCLKHDGPCFDKCYYPLKKTTRKRKEDS